MALIRINAEKLLHNLEDIPTKSQIAIKMLAQQGAMKMQNYAKSHKRWTNRTGHAQQRLIGYVTSTKDVTRINIAHGVDYGKWLELCNEKRFAILEETVVNNAKEILESMTDLMDHLRP